MTPDQVSGIISGVYGLTVFTHCWKLWQSEETRGTSVLSVFAGFCVCVAFGVTFWQADLWWSFAGNAVIAWSNVSWLSMLLWYRCQLPKLARVADDHYPTPWRECHTGGEKRLVGPGMWEFRLHSSERSV